MKAALHGTPYFNPRSLTGATFHNNPLFTKTSISIHAPSRERHKILNASYNRLKFQSTLPHGSDPSSPSARPGFRYFNPRSLTGATIILFCSCAKQEISIHAPSRERLTALIKYIHSIKFQSTLPHGSDPSSPSARPGFRYFNPRSLTGATIILFCSCAKQEISIHAPSRERLTALIKYIHSIKFQSTLPHGSDLMQQVNSGLCWQFQSTLPHGSDLLSKTERRMLACDFNPRSLTGATLFTTFYNFYRPISIHAPSRERLFIISLAINFDILFQSTLPHGSDQHRYQWSMDDMQFQSTLPHGSDCILTRSSCIASISIHAPSRERLGMGHCISGKKTFQSTLPHGSDCCSIGFNITKLQISIHAPSRERLGRSTISAPRSYFNPRSLTGATQCQQSHTAEQGISIHAPSRERLSICSLD